MERAEKINLFEEILDLELGTLSESTLLVDIEEFDSMSKLSLIVLMDDEFGKKLTGEQLREFKTVADVIDFMG